MRGEMWTSDYWFDRGFGDCREFVDCGGEVDAYPVGPFSGEFAGESIPELFGIPVGGEWPDADTLDELERAYYEGWAKYADSVSA